MPDSMDCLKKLLMPASARPDKASEIAIIEAPGDRAITFADLESLINGAESYLRQYGIKKGERIVLTSPNSARLAAAILATWRLGGVCIPIDFKITAPERINITQRLGARALVGSTRMWPDFIDDHKALKESSTAILDLDAIVPAVSPKDWTGDEILRGLDADAPALVILTSGTTGMPKGALHDLGSLCVNLVELGEMVNLTSDKRLVLPLPLSHIFGLEVTLICLLFGGTIAFSDMSPSGFISALARHKPHILVGVPTIYGAMLALPKEEAQAGLANAEVLLCGGAPLPLSLALEFERIFGKMINNGFGSTESKIIALNLDGPMESIGKHVPSVKVEIVNDDDQPLSEGEIGEIRIGGPILMKGYVDQPEATEKVLHRGHYHTGDIGYVKDGYIYISGRAKEMIIVAGNKVFPAEVEDVLRKNPAVKEVAVIGLPHRQLGQIVKAIVVVSEERMSELLSGDSEARKSARQELLASFKEYCRANLKRELRPMDWEFRPASDPLPKTSSGKVDKKKLEAVTASH
ncbi:MAG TPA: AMP-binding protein [Candidatus Obscuribacterales bacterium]